VGIKKIITIDGPAGSGKSTVSRLLAKRLGYLYLDTGAMYRAAALQSLRQGVTPTETERLGRLCKAMTLQFRVEEGENRLYLGAEDISAAIRTPEMDLLASTVSAVKEVREAMTELQRELGKKGCIVAEGRDMGTVVFPEAGFKFFLTADAEVRAERRYRERILRGESVRKEEVEKELAQRDEQDTLRPIAPLRPPKDARIIDSSALSPDQIVRLMLDTIRNEQEGSQNFLVQS
jgi:cytidylate kinase